MLGQIIAPPQRHVQRFTALDLDRIERRCAYRHQGRRNNTSAPNETLPAFTWTPTTEVDLLMWIDMLDPTTYTVNGGGTGISAIKNKATNVSLTLPVNNTPYEATGVNGKPCLHPIVIGDRMTFTE